MPTSTDSFVHLHVHSEYSMLDVAARLGELTKAAAEWLITRKPRVLGYDFAQEEKGRDYQTADEILSSGMRVHRTILPNVTCQIENLVNLDQIPPKVKVIARKASRYSIDSSPIAHSKGTRT